MASNQQTNRNLLVAKCECAIQRGNVPYLETLQKLQQKLVAAQDAHQQSEMEAEIRTAVEFYHRHISANERTTTLGDLAEAFERLSTELETVKCKSGRTATDSLAKGGAS